MENPIFILGCPRSGTTLLSGMLTHSSYGTPVESHFIIKYYKKLKRYGDLKNKNNFQRLLQQILSERPVRQWNLKIEPESFYAEMKEISYKEIVNKLFMTRSEAKGTRSWGDKTPSYILDLDILYKLFPDSKYIYIVRDGRDVALSLLQKPWGPRNLFSCAHYWKLCNEKNGIFDRLSDKNQLYFLRYEDLLNDANQVIHNLYTFLGEEKNLDRINPLLSKIRRNNYNNWKTAMNKQEIALFESLTSNTLKRFGYETSHAEKKVGSLSASYFRLHNCVARAVYLFKLNTIDAAKIRFLGKQPFAE